MVPYPVPKTTPIYIAGHRGLVGSAVWRHFSKLGYEQLIGVESTRLDLRDARATRDFFESVRPEVVIDAAARTGGIIANSSSPSDFVSDNLRIQVNLLDSAVAVGVQRFLFLGSSCIYPKHAAQPISEDALLTGPLEPTNEGYAVAKIAGIVHVASIRRQYGLPFISAMPTNIYGPGDHFHPRNSHVLPAMIRRFHDAVVSGDRSVTCWGTGTPRREFLHADDLASACHFLLEQYDADEPVNVGTGVDCSIAELAEMVADIAEYRGEIEWDVTKPDGTPQKLLDVSRLTRLGWKAQLSLVDGVRSTYRWFAENQGSYRS